MPKIIENLESRLAEEAKEQVARLGYSAVTVRSVAAACGVGVGTVYNYYASKDELLAAYLLQEWKERVRSIDAVSAAAGSPHEVLACMYEQLRGFVVQNENVFCDEQAAEGFAGSVGRYHGLLRSQLAGPLRKFCEGAFQAEFAAEAMLTWSVAGKTFDEIYGILGKLF